MKDDHGPLRERQRTRRVSDRIDGQVTLGLDSGLAGRDGGAWQSSTEAEAGPCLILFSARRVTIW